MCRQDERVMQLQNRLNVLVDELLVQARDDRLGELASSSGSLMGELDLSDEAPARADLSA
jgi:hypothetical protein